MTLRIGIVVGEASGDILGAGLIKAIKAYHPDAVFEGIAGPLMLAEGAQSFFPQDRLAVMGFVEPLKRLPELLRIRKFLKKHFTDNPPDLFIGIDSPDFNLDLELALKQAGVLTAHYVSPSVWAWRQWRVKKIKKAVDCMLTLFPFEVDFYQQHQIVAKCVGHTLADQIPLEPDVSKARQVLELTHTGPIIALLPGSRGGEVERMLPVFLAAAALAAKKMPDLLFVIAAANEARLSQIEQAVADCDCNCQVIFKQSHEVMLASDLVVMASGTTTLEAMLLKKPMVIAYKVAAFSYFIFKRMVKVPFVGLPNLLARRELAREYIQDQATPENIATEIIRLLDHQGDEQLQTEYRKLHLLLKQNASDSAAQTLLGLIAQRAEEAKSC